MNSLPFCHMFDLWGWSWCSPASEVIDLLNRYSLDPGDTCECLGSLNAAAPNGFNHCAIFQGGQIFQGRLMLVLKAMAFGVRGWRGADRNKSVLLGRTLSLQLVQVITDKNYGCLDVPLFLPRSREDIPVFLTFHLARNLTGSIVYPALLT